jgi:hypothetical protein
MCHKDRLSKPTGSGTADIRGIRFYSEIRVALIHTPGSEIKDTKYEIHKRETLEVGTRCCPLSDAGICYANESV